MSDQLPPTVIDRLTVSQSAEPPVDNIIEIDGPARAYFDIPTGVKNIGMDIWVRVIYRAIQFASADSEMVRSEWAIHLAEIRRELNELGGGVIWWRTRPEFSVEKRSGKGNHRAVHVLYARLATSPQLPDAVWIRLHWKRDERVGIDEAELLVAKS